MLYEYVFFQRTSAGYRNFGSSSSMQSGSRWVPRDVSSKRVPRSDGVENGRWLSIRRAAVTQFLLLREPQHFPSQVWLSNSLRPVRRIRRHPSRQALRLRARIMESSTYPRQSRSISISDKRSLCCEGLNL